MLEPEHPSGDRRDAPDPASGHPAGVTRFVADVRAALGEPQAARRLSLAGVRARIDLTDADVSVVLLLDRFPPEVTTDPVADQPTVRLRVASDELGSMLAEGSHLPMAILSGDVVFEGSVRKLLRVLPILRGAALDANYRRDEM